MFQMLEEHSNVFESQAFHIHIFENNLKCKKMMMTMKKKKTALNQKLITKKYLNRALNNFVYSVGLEL